MVDLVQLLCTRSCSAVHNTVSINGFGGLSWDKGGISRFKHFWHNVFAEALVGPRRVGALR